MEIFWGLIYIGAVLVIYSAIIGIFIFILRREQDWKEWLWYKIVLMCLATDILSTLYFVYILGFGWEIEANITVRTYGSLVGNFNALLINHLSLAGFIGLVGLFFRKKLTFVYIFICTIFTIMLTQATLSNLLFPTLKFFMGK